MAAVWVEANKRPDQLTFTPKALTHRTVQIKWLCGAPGTGETGIGSIHASWMEVKDCPVLRAAVSVMNLAPVSLAYVTPRS